MKNLLLGILGLMMFSLLEAKEVVKIEHIQSGWKFSTLMPPSQSDAGHTARVSVCGNQPIASCLDAQGLVNGVLPQECRLLRDFFCFTNLNATGGKIAMDLGKVTPISMINSYSAHGPVGGTTWCEEFDGSRGPQVYTVYGSKQIAPDCNNPNSGEWVKIAEVDTRPKDANADWVGQYGVNIQTEDGSLLGEYRWIVWEVESTFKPNADNAFWTDTWYTELDVHTPDTQSQGGDAILAGTQLEEIIVVYKTHFDIGFTHPAPEIVGTYRTEMIDKALDIIDESSQWPLEKRFSWTIPSWVAYQIIWEGQDPVRLKRVEEAIKSGRLVVHGLPVTVQTESLEPEDLVFGLSLNKEISNRLGIPLSRSGKMTDVPSHSWIWPTIFKHAGMDFLHIGVNPTNERPDLPLLYYWEGADGSRLLTMHSQGYGSDTEFGHGLYPPKNWPFKHWLAMIVSSDNAGPPSSEEVEKLLAEAKRNLPGVKIRFGQMEDFADAIFAEEKAGAMIPVVRADMPDCWIHGMGTMPVEEAMAHVTRSRMVSVKVLDSHLRMWGMDRPDSRDSLFIAHERSLMYGEHTWGGSQNLEGRQAYGKIDFEDYIQTDDRCKWLTSTWKDHADYIHQASEITSELLQRDMNKLAATVSVKGDRLVVYNPLPWERDALVKIPGTSEQKMLVKAIPACGYRTYPLPANRQENREMKTNDKMEIENDYFRIRLDRERGGIISIINKKDGREMVDPASPHAFGTYLYERFDSLQNLNYHQGCSHLNTVYGYNGRGCRGWNVRKDLPSQPTYQSAVPVYEQMSVYRETTGTTVTLTASPKDIIRSKVYTTIFLPNDLPWIEIQVKLEDKKPDYWPEAGSIYLPVHAEHPRFRIGRLGSVVDPVCDFAKGSNRTYGYVNTGAMIGGADGKGLAVCPLDHGLMSFGEKGMCSIDPEYVPTTPLAKVSMFNTIWTINFPYWIQGDLSSRVRIWSVENLDEEHLINPALEARQEVLTGIATGNGGHLPAVAKGMTFSRKGIRITSFGCNPDGAGDLLRLWEAAGQSGHVSVVLPKGSTFTQAIPVDLRGKKIGQPIPIVKGSWSFEMKRYAPHSYLLK